MSTSPNTGCALATRRLTLSRTTIVRHLRVTPGVSSGSQQGEDARVEAPSERHQAKDQPYQRHEEAADDLPVFFKRAQLQSL